MTAHHRVSQAMAATLHISVRSAHELRRWWRWFFAPLCDDWKGLSLNRFLAVLFGLAGALGSLSKPRVPLTGWDVATMVIAGSLAFGKDVWVNYLQTKQRDTGESK
jgi:hypothetical protein